MGDSSKSFAKLNCCEGAGVLDASNVEREREREESNFWRRAEKEHSQTDTQREGERKTEREIKQVVDGNSKHRKRHKRQRYGHQ